MTAEPVHAARPDATSAPPAEITGRWRDPVVLKRDVFSTVERGTFIDDTGRAVPATVRRIDGVPWWTALLSRYFLAREARALRAAEQTGFVPKILFAGNGVLVREWLDGLPLQVSKPSHPQFYRDAMRAIRALRKLGITHNDLAKQQNWLCTPDGQVRIIDFQLATIHRRRGLFYRMTAYGDFRHTVKQKRRYARSSMTPTEWRVFGSKGAFATVWMATGKRLYQLVTRRLLNFRDGEGGGRRLANDAPVIVARLNACPGVNGAVVVAYPDRRAGVGLYAFVAAPGRPAAEVTAFLRQSVSGKTLPEHLQVVDRLPRDTNGAVRSEILQLIALNQIDLIPPILRNDAERRLVDAIVAGRTNLGDRFGHAPVAPGAAALPY